MAPASRDHQRSPTLYPHLNRRGAKTCTTTHTTAPLPTDYPALQSAAEQDPEPSEDHQEIIAMPQEPMISQRDTPRRSSRVHRPPAHLKDYVTDF